jgi:hypothetical protein
MKQHGRGHIASPVLFHEPGPAASEADRQRGSSQPTTRDMQL